MPRKRTISDQVLLDEALVVVRADGPDALTFGALAPRVGLAGSTIVQRYGTKAALLQAALLRAWDLLDQATAAAIDAAAPDAAGAIDMLVQLSGQYDANDFADQLLVLREDLRDPVLRVRGDVWLTTLGAAVEERLGAGFGELVLAHWQGTLTVWSFTRRVPLRTAVRNALEDLLERLGLFEPAA